MSRTIWVDATDFLTWQGHLTGIQRVLAMLAGGMKVELGDKLKYIYFDPTINRFYKADTFSITKDGVVSGKLRKNRIFDGDRSIPLRIIRKIYANIFRPPNPEIKDGDILFIPGSNLAYPRFGPKMAQLKDKYNLKVVHVMHDVLPLSTPQFFDPKLCEDFLVYFSDVMRYSDHIVSVSQATDREVEEYFGELLKTHDAKRHVIHSGSSIQVKQSGMPKNFSYEPSEYLFSWGTVEPRKNRELLYAAYKYAQREAIDLPPLVIAGKVGWLSTDFMEVLVRDESLNNKITFVESPADHELIWLIENCKFTLFPSHAEGWGLPIAESLFYGKTCISTKTSSMPEVAGDVISYVDNPYDAAEMAKAIQRLAIPKNLAAAEKKVREFKPISWDKSVSDYLKLLKSL